MQEKENKGEEFSEIFKKRFKDPLYDYIEIDNTIVSKIIDTPSFQRLKDIRQTSYTPLYPAAHHNRYVHSLGVYHLGCMAFRAIKPQLVRYSKDTKICDKIDMIQRIFELACLLHDVGHAPFSHTGEKFYLDEAETLYTSLKESVNKNEFSDDFNALGVKKPAPHECMSCVVGLRTYSNYFENAEQRDLFARCIIGMPMTFNEKEPASYESKMSQSEKKEIKRERERYNSKKKEIELFNCIISLLNSSIIDVDRLDYIIRDSVTIGFKNAQVDYMRLLDGLRIVEYEKPLDSEKQKSCKKKQKKLCIGYHKSALSVIESAIYAHDAEKKWIQGHPAILYEMAVLQNAMEQLTQLFSSAIDPNPIFCYEALTETGKELSIPISLFSEEARILWDEKKLFSNKANILLFQRKLFCEENGVDTSNLTVYRKFPLSLLADEDFLYLMKIFCKDGLGYEYFARNKRRYAAWKSEAEFRALFQERIGDDSKNIKILEANFEGLVDYCMTKTGVPIVSESIYCILEDEEKEALFSRENDEFDDEYYEDIVRGIKEKRRWIKVLENIADELELNFEFLIIFQKKFSSSFRPSVGDIPILFPNLDDSVISLKSVIDVLRSSAEKKSNFFHVFYSPRDSCKKDKKEIVNTIAKRLISGISL